MCCLARLVLQQAGDTPFAWSNSMRPLTTDPRFQPQFQPLASPTLPPADVVDFRGYFKVDTFGHGAVIYRPALPPDKVYLLRPGRVRLLRQGQCHRRSGPSLLEPA